MSDNDTVIGVIEKINERTTSYGAMYDVDVNGMRYGCGKIKPKFEAGDCVKFSTRKNGNFTNVIVATMEKHDVQVPTAATETLTQVSTPQARSAGPTYEDKDSNRQNSIVLQSARKDAIEVTKLLLQADALGFKATTKWGEKQELVLARINDLTRTFFHNTNDWKAFTGPTPPKVAPVQESSDG